MTGGPALDAGIGFSLRVPPNWFEPDVHPATREASVRELVRDRIAQVPELRERRREITKLLSDQAARAWDAGAVYCAGMGEPVEDGVLPVSCGSPALALAEGLFDLFDALTGTLRPHDS